MVTVIFVTVINVKIVEMLIHMKCNENKREDRDNDERKKEIIIHTEWIKYVHVIGKIDLCLIKYLAKRKQANFDGKGSDN